MNSANQDYIDALLASCQKRNYLRLVSACLFGIINIGVALGAMFSHVFSDGFFVIETIAASFYLVSILLSLVGFFIYSKKLRMIFKKRRYIDRIACFIGRLFFLGASILLFFAPTPAYSFLTYFLRSVAWMGSMYSFFLLFSDVRALIILPHDPMIVLSEQYQTQPGQRPSPNVSPKEAQKENFDPNQVIDVEAVDKEDKQ